MPDWSSGRFEVALDVDTVRVTIEQGAKCLGLPGGLGIVMGRLFRRGEEKPVDTLSDREADEIVDTSGACLIDHYWGGFVGVVLSRQSGLVHIIRDPSPEQPCYYVKARGALFAASDFALLHDRESWTATIDWQAVAAFLWRPQIRPERTCLAGLRELLAGERLTFDGEAARCEMTWSPWTFTRREALVVDRMQAITMLREAVTSAVRGWAGCFDHVLLGVSGGLDSSILAAVLRSSPTRLTMLTMATQGRSGDERDYCRELGAFLSTPVIEAHENPNRVDLFRSDATHVPRPLARAFSQSADRVFDRIAGEHGVDAYMTGGGGDNVFCYLTSGASLADRIQVDGIGRGAIETAHDISRLTGASVAAVAWSAFQRGWLRKRAYRWPLQGALLDPSTRDAVTAVGDHPWMDVPAKTLPGKATHVAWILGVQNALEGFARERERPILSPLMAQPIMEACLRIPTWHWVSGGLNRSAARAAFADSLPPSIVNRRSKGTPDSFAIELLDTHRAETLDYLLSGRLADQGILNRVAVEEALGRAAILRDVSFVDILRLVDSEAWIRAIEDHGR